MDDNNNTLKITLLVVHLNIMGNNNNQYRSNHGFLCTMHLLQCNCARELCVHPRDWNL